MTIVLSGCFPMLKVQQLNSDILIWNRLYIDIKFKCHGFITRWHYYAHTIGSAFLDVFRPNNDGSFTLISKTKVTATELGVKIHTLAPEDWIEVEPGFIIGCHYQDSSSIAKVITEENTKFHQTVYPPEQLSDVMATPDLYDAGLIIGAEHTPTNFYPQNNIPAINVDITTNSKYKQMYHLHAYIQHHNLLFVLMFMDFVYPFYFLKYSGSFHNCIHCFHYCFIDYHI